MKTKTKKIPKLRRQKGRDLGYVSISGRKTYLKGKYTDDGADSQLKASYRRFVEQFEARGFNCLATHILTLVEMFRYDGDDSSDSAESKITKASRASSNNH